MSSQFVVQNLRQKSWFGGEEVRGRRKQRRPIATKRAMHLVLKSSGAVGRYSLLRSSHSVFVREQVSAQSARWGVRVYAFSNNGNHLHLLIQAKDVPGFVGFDWGA
jgi:REP element-mobilizing transposase RayT